MPDNRTRIQTTIRVDASVRDELADLARSVDYTLNELLQLLAATDPSVVLLMADRWALAASMSGRNAARESSRLASIGEPKGFVHPFDRTPGAKAND